jgi:REP element-mobilizing transposase RayT
MTSEWRPDFDPEHLYFITTTAVQHKYLFRRDVMKRLIVDTLDCMRLRGRFKLYGFVVMPNHVHFIIQCWAEDPFAAVLRDFKKHVADRMLRQYETEGNAKVLAFLASAVTRRDRRHKVWEDGYNAKDVFSADFFLQKLTYIHNNPCQAHWALVEYPQDYVWSSARFYLAEQRGLIPVDSADLVLM